MLKIANLFKPKLANEAMEAYLNKLPDTIQVEWSRDGKFIVGKITTEGSQYFTQALSAEEFIDMVNDTLMTVYEIPIEYQNAILKNKKFRPSIEQFNTLKNTAIKKSSLTFEMQLAY